MPNQTSNSIAVFSPPVGRKQGSQSSKKTFKSRLGHSIDPVVWDALKRCEFQIAACAGPVSNLDPRLSGRWNTYRPFVRKDFHRLYDVIVPVLVKDGVAPEDLTTEHLSAALRRLQEHDRQIHRQSKDSRERCLWTVLSTVTRGLILAGQGHAVPRNWRDLERLPGRSQHRTSTATGLPPDLTRELKRVEKRLAVTFRSRVQKNYWDTLCGCCRSLIAHGHHLSTLANLLEEPTLKALVQIWEDENARPETCERRLEILRWLASVFFDSEAARKNVTFWVTQCKAQRPGPDTMIDAPKLLQWTEKNAFRSFLTNLTEIAKTGGGKRQARSKVRNSAGACLCLLVLYCLVEASELPKLNFGEDGQPVWSEEYRTEAQKRWGEDAHVQNALGIPRVAAALAGYRDLFYASYGRLPHSLADGLNYARDYAGIVPSRMQAALEIAGQGKRPKDLPAIVVTLLLRQNRPASEVSLCAGYSNPLSFDRRYLPVQRLIASLQARNSA